MKRPKILIKDVVRSWGCQYGTDSTCNKHISGGSRSGSSKNIPRKKSLKNKQNITGLHAIKNQK